MDKRTKGKKPPVREFSAGGAVFRRKVSKAGKVSKVSMVEWLIIKPAGTKRWQLPKGHIEEGERGEDAAVREVFEETGARVKVSGKIDRIQYFYVLEGQKIFKNVVFFLMECVDGLAKIDGEWAHEVDEVCWLAPRAALRRLTFEGERKILQKAGDMLKTGLQEQLV